MILWTVLNTTLKPSCHVAVSSQDFSRFLFFFSVAIIVASLHLITISFMSKHQQHLVFKTEPVCV